MFSRASFRNLRHKTKKGMMKRIGMTSSRPEDPNFKNLLAILSKVKAELKETNDTARNVAASGKQFHEELENFCGLGLRSENVFFKEADFINSFRERVCTALGKIAGEDIDTLNGYIAQYKTAKLRFDAAYFQTVKRMRKSPEESLDPEKEEDVMGSNNELANLLLEYKNSKDMVWGQRDVIVSHLKKKVGESLLELKEVSHSQHHQLCCQYFAKRLMQIVELLAAGPDPSNEPCPLLSATFADKTMRAQRAKNLSAEASSEASSLISATLSQFVGSKPKNKTTKNKPKISHCGIGNGVQTEDKEEKRESVETLPIEHDKGLQGESPYQVIETQKTSGGELLNVGVAG
jgi:hypothetical protein